MRNKPWFRASLVYLPIILAVALLIGLFALAESGQKRLQKAAQSVATSQWRQAALSDFMRLMIEIESATRGFLLTENPAYLAPYDPAGRRVDALIDRLSTSYLREGDEVGMTAVRNLRMRAGKRRGVSDSILRLYGEVSRQAAVSLVETGMDKRAMDDIRLEAIRLRTHEAAVLMQLTRTWQRDLELNRLILAAGTFLNILLVIAAGWLLQRHLRRGEMAARELTEHNRQLDEIVQERTRDLSELSSHLQTVSENEKSALGRELHDELGGLLISTKMDVVWLRRKLDNGDSALAERRERVLRSLEEGLTFKRRIIESLRPTLLDNLGLVPALSWLTDETCRRSGLVCNETYPNELEPLNAEASIALFRVVQECLTNTMKHARATEVDIDLSTDAEGLHLTIRDNGVGIAANRVYTAQSHGLSSMRHRVTALGGKLDVRAGVGGRGTTVRVDIPWQAVRNDAPASD